MVQIFVLHSTFNNLQWRTECSGPLTIGRAGENKLSLDRLMSEKYKDLAPLLKAKPGDYRNGQIFRFYEKQDRALAEKVHEIDDQHGIITFRRDVFTFTCLSRKGAQILHKSGAGESCGYNGKAQINEGDTIILSGQWQINVVSIRSELGLIRALRFFGSRNL